MTTKRVYNSLPCHAVPMGDLWVKSRTSAGGLKKDAEYAVRLITDKGLFQLVGNIDRLFPMSSFSIENFDAAGSKVGNGTPVDKSGT